MEPYRIVRGAVPREVTDRLLRRIWLEVVTHGLTPDEIRDWSATTWFPWLRWEPAVDHVRSFAHAHVGPPRPGERWADPQLLVRLPDWPNAEWRMTAHVDELPPWAEPGERYRAIIGVALTDSTEANGCLHVRMNHEWIPVPIRRGDLVILRPDVGHSGGLNYGPEPRVVVYYRLLAGSSPA